MNTVLAAIDPAIQQQLHNLQIHAAVSVYAALIFAVGFAVLAVVTVLIAFRLNRSALALLALYGFLTFWIPSGPTLVFSPVIFLGSIAGIFWLSVSKKKALRAA